MMKIQDVLTPSFRLLRHQLGHDRPKDRRPMWQQRLSADSDFCRAVVSNGYLSEQQMQRAAQRYRLGKSRDGGVIFWQTDQLEQLYDGKIMYYQPDCHRDHERHPQWVTNLMKRHYLKGYDELAAGGLYELTAQKLFPLKGRKIILFPDTDPERKAYGTWYRVMTEAQRLLNQPILISPLLELEATPEQKQRKIDLIDFLFDEQPQTLNHHSQP